MPSSAHEIFDDALALAEMIVEGQFFFGEVLINPEFAAAIGKAQSSGAGGSNKKPVYARAGAILDRIIKALEEGKVADVFILTGGRITKRETEGQIINLHAARKALHKRTTISPRTQALLPGHRQSRIPTPSI